jgi:predicted nuclease with TOPRIM domain
MSEPTENAATRLWRDRVQLREQERDEAQARARLAEEQVAALTAEINRIAAENARLRDLSDRLAIKTARLGDQNDLLATEVARLRALRTPDSACAETEREVEALKSAMLSLLDRASASSLH